MDIFVKRPVLAIVISLVITVAGIIAALKIPVLQFPKIEGASLVIETEYEGSSAEVVQGFITDPIERIAMTIPGVDFVDSQTTPGRSKVTAWLNLNEDSVDALAELNAKLSQINYELPAGAQDPSVSVVRVDRPGAAFYLNVLSDSMNRSQLTDYLKRNVVPQLSSIDGVQRIGLEGGRDPAMRVWLSPMKMASAGIGADDVFTALAQNNVISTLGKTENDWQEVHLLSNATLRNADDFEQLIVTSSNGAEIRLRDIARVEQGEDRGMVNARLDQSETVFISIWPLPGANEIAVGDALYRRLAEVEKLLPAGVEISIGFDGTLYMRDAVKEIFTTLIETVILVGLVVLLLMGSFRTALVPLITIPIAILGSIAAMVLMGFSMNLLTILAIVLSVGLVVDDAIVVVENVARHMREGKPRIEAALISSRELLSPIIAMTITLALVYAPIGFVSGLTGALFKEFAFTLAVAVLISGVVAITLSPIMSAHVSPENGKEGAMTLWVNRQFDHLAEIYHMGLLWTLERKSQVLTSAVILSLLSVPFYLFSAKELAPVEDQSTIFMVSDAPPGASLAYSTNHMYDVIDALDDDPAVDAIWQIVNPGNGFAGINYVEFKERDQPVQAILPSVYYQLTQVPGLKVFPLLPLPLPTAGQFDVELVVKSQDDYETMAGYVQQLIGAAYGTQMFMFVETDLKFDQPMSALHFDHRRIADFGLNVEQVVAQVSSLVSEQDVNRFDANGKAYRVIPTVEADARTHTESLMDLQIKLPDNSFVPLGSIASLEPTVGPRQMGKFDQQRAFRIMGGIVPGVTSDQALTALETAAREILPPDYTFDYAGVSRQLRKEGNSMVGVLVVALFVVYLVLAVQFNSFRAPLVVLAGSVPLALSGAMMFSFLGLTTLNIYTQIGLITLVGLVAKNGILITEFANELQLQGRMKAEAIIEAAKIRLRPILMTTAATVLGHFPLVLVTGPGAEARNSIGIVLVAGMVIGTFFTLFVVPNVYMLLGDNLADADDSASKNTPPATQDSSDPHLATV